MKLSKSETFNESSLKRLLRQKLPLQATLVAISLTTGGIAYASNGGGAPPMRPGEGFYETDSPTYQTRTSYPQQSASTNYSSYQESQAPNNAYRQVPTSTVDQQNTQ
jgi:hypothetical protein